MQPSTHPNGEQAHAAPPDRISTRSSPKTGIVLAAAATGLVALLGVGFATAYAVRHQSEEHAAHEATTASGARAMVNVVAVQPTPNNYPLTLPGQTAGWYQSTIYGRVDGYIGSWSADIGDRVKQGQTLATIETPDIDQQLAAAKAKAAASDAQVEVAQSNVEIAEVTYKRWVESKPGVVSQQERDEKKANFAAAKARLLEAKAQADLDRANVKRYETMQGFREVQAPYDGVVTGRKVDVGNLVTAGSSANTTPLYTVAQPNLLRVFVDVPQKAVGDMAVGLAASVTCDQYPGRAFKGKVARSTRAIDPATRTEQVEVDVPNADLALMPGMYVQVTFQLNQRGLVQVPAAAILFKPTGLQVAVVADDGKVDFREVKVAKDDGDVVELSAGVRADERVALNISSAVAQGQQVDAVDNEKDHGLPTPEGGATTEPAARPRVDREPAPNSGTNPPAPAKAPTTQN